MDPDDTVRLPRPAAMPGARPDRSADPGAAPGASSDAAADTGAPPADGRTDPHAERPTRGRTRPPAMAPHRPTRRGPDLAGPTSQARRRWLLPLAAAAVAGATGTALLLLPDDAPRPGEPTTRPPDPDPPLRTEAELAAPPPADPTMVRLAENPRVFVLLFPDLETQAASLNRVAALVEKAGLPRDRVLPDAELAEAIARTGSAPTHWFLGHDYRGRDLARFFALAARDGIALNPGETWLRAAFLRARALVAPEEEVALISVGGPGQGFDATLRAVILRHEIGHGHYFTRPDFAAHVRHVWDRRFTDAERAAFREFLGREGYDTNDDELMANETMAYLLFTPDARFFRPSLVRMTEAAVERLRALLREGIDLP